MERPSSEDWISTRSCTASDCAVELSFEPSPPKSHEAPDARERSASIGRNHVLLPNAGTQQFYASRAQATSTLASTLESAPSAQELGERRRSGSVLRDRSEKGQHRLALAHVGVETDGESPDWIGSAAELGMNDHSLV
jgi:hypothetical protein